METWRLKWSELKSLPKMETSTQVEVVEERPVMHWSFDVSQGGVYRSENADISSDSPDENSGYRKPKVSEATSIGFGSVDTKGSAIGGIRCPNR